MRQKTVFSNHSEVAHIWAQQTQQTGRSGNVSFDGGKIMSYHWWTMANFVRPDLVLIRNWSYSNSTSKHMGHVRSSIPGFVDVISVYDPDVSPGLYKPGHIDNIKDYIEQLKDSFHSFYKGRSENKGHYVKQNAGELAALLRYCELMKCKGILKKFKTELWEYTITEQFEPETIDRLIKDGEKKFNDNLTKQ